MKQMHGLSASELMGVWEQGTGEHPVDRALILLSACSRGEREELATLSIGQRDTRLLEVYEQLFGPTIDCFAQCPQCREQLEYQVSVSNLISQSHASEAPLILETEQGRIHLRLPNSLDLRALNKCSDTTSAYGALLKRCVLDVSLNGETVQLNALEESTIEKVAAYLAAADPQADTLIHLSCCACRYAWQVIFDVEKLLWRKIDALAKRLLLEVHTLAKAYGWSEADILTLSARRRQAYLEMVAS